MITEKLADFKEALLKDRLTTTKAKKSLDSWEIMVNEIPEILKNAASLNEKLIVTGSIGKGIITETPWLGIFDTDLTRSAQNGYYIVYLFRSDLSGFYLSLNQGWTQYELEFGIKEGKKRIVENAIRAQKVLRSTSSFSFDKIDLFATKTLGKGYELGNICSKYYSLNDLTDDNNFIDDLRNLIGTYRELKGLVGSNILDIQSKASEDEFQNDIQLGKVKDLPAGSLKRKARTITEKSSFAWGRDANIAFTALNAANFKCENNPMHETFISARTNHQFVEAHHLIPMEFQNDFENSLDVPENIISICPTCHRAFHHGEQAYRNDLVSKFHKSRLRKLTERGIGIELNELLLYYKVYNPMHFSLKI